MKVHTLVRAQEVAAPIETVFDFFCRPENLQHLTPAALDFRFLTPLPIAMREGALIDYALRVHGLPVHWRTLITLWDPPHQFVDQQIKGPYLFWHHTHRFTPLASGGTRLEDEVRYAMPFGPIGELVLTLLVQRDLDNIFAFRQRRVAVQFQ